MPFVIEQKSQPETSIDSNGTMDSMTAYTLVLLLVVMVFHRVILFLIFAGLKLTLLGVFGFATYKLFLS